MSIAFQPMLQRIIRSKPRKLLLVAGIVLLLLIRGIYQIVADAVLYDGAEAGNSQQVKIALKFGADPNAKDPELYTTALMEASRQGDIATVQALLSGGANVNAVSDYGSVTTALGNAKSYNHPSIVVLLKQAGAKR